MSPPETLPIFPLPMAVLPSEYQLLHIFEDRYKKLVRDCRDRHAAGQCPEFGVVFCDSGGLSCTGTSVAITHILKEYDDGRFEIVARGKRRFQVRRVRRLDLYDSAEVEWFDDPPGDDWDETLATQAYTLHRRFFELLNGSAIPDNAYCRKMNLSMHIGQLAGLAPKQKVDLLRMRCENERLQFLIQHFQGMLPQVEQVEASRLMVQDAWAVARFLACGCKETESGS